MFKGSIPALVTPMRDDGAIDFEAWDRLLDFHLAEGSDAVVVGGTTGESPALERVGTRGADPARPAAACGPDSGDRRQRHGRHGKEHRACRKRPRRPGRTRLLVVTPYYNRPTQEGLFQHFTAIADAVGIPLVLYNVPGRTACDMLPETIARLSRHPRIVGGEGGDRRRRARTWRSCGSRGPGFVLLSGDDATAAALMRVGRARRDLGDCQRRGSRPCMSCAPQRCAGDHDEAAAINERLTPLHKALFVEPNPIPVKWAVHRMGLIGQGIRLPLVAVVRGRCAPKSRPRCARPGS